MNGEIPSCFNNHSSHTEKSGVFLDGLKKVEKEMFYFLKMYTYLICLRRLGLMIATAINVLAFLTDGNHKCAGDSTNISFVLDYKTASIISTSFRASISPYVVMIDVV